MPRSPLLALLRRLWDHLPSKRKYQLVAMLVTMLASGLAEIASLAAVVPFLTVLTDPGRLWSQPWVRDLARARGLTEPAQLVLPGTLLFIVAAIASGGVRLVNLWLTGRVAAGTGSDLSQEAFRRTLYQPYAVHMGRHSATITTAMLSHVDGLIYGVLNPLLLIAANVAVVVAIAAGLVIIDPRVAFLTVATFGTAYLCLSVAARRSLASNSRRQAERSKALVRDVQESLGAIRDVLLDHSQPYYLARHRDADWSMRQLRARADLLAGYPRFVIEAGAMAGVAGLAHVLVSRPGGIAAALPVLGALALGAQRLLPALQQTYVSWTQVQNHVAGLEIMLDLLDQPAPAIDAPRPVPMAFRESLTLENVSFRYQPDLPPVLKDVSLKIRRGDRVALVGPTGGGKSTLTDILMGLLQPTDGRVLVDGREFVPEAWQANIAHVPQAIFLADASIAENIALGVPEAEVDRDGLEEAARLAQIAEFVDGLPQGYATMVGERGVRLSGGQRQRVGIARALYKRSPVLVFDEATSALDDATERSLMETLDRLSRDLTIVMVAHRLSTTAYCDRMIEVSDGTVREVVATARTSLG